MGAYTVNGETYVEISNGGCALPMATFQTPIVLFRIPGLPLRDIYWITFGLMFASFLCFMVLTFMKPFQARSHGYVTTAIVFIASTAYYAMAINDGYANIQVTNARNTVRAIYYARYIDWFCTTPLLLLDLLLMAAIPLGDTLWILFADVAMILVGLFGALTDTHFKWGWYVGGCILQLIVAWGMLVHGVAGANARGPGIGRLYTFLAFYLVFFWFGYPIIWGLAEGGNVISSTAEAFCYAVLDILTKVVFGWTIMLTLNVVDRQSEEERARNKWAPSLLDLPTDRPLQLVTGGRDHGVGISQGYGTGYLFSKLARSRNKTGNAPDVPAQTTMDPVPVEAPAPVDNTAHLQETYTTRVQPVPVAPTVLNT